MLAIFIRHPLVYLTSHGYDPNFIVFLIPIFVYFFVCKRFSRDVTAQRDILRASFYCCHILWLT
jgi:hypothetical protein